MITSRLCCDTAFQLMRGDCLCDPVRKRRREGGKERRQRRRRLGCEWRAGKWRKTEEAGLLECETR